MAGAADTEAVDRPRFLGLTEFGPGNLLYHEGRRHRVVATILPLGDLLQRLRSAKLCRACGHANAGEDFTRDRCVFCNALLEGAGVEIATQLLDQPTVRAQRQLRISSEEEERVRLGYDVATHFRGGECRTARFAASDGRPVLEAIAVLRAELWRINHGWRQGGGRQGFSLDWTTGRWIGRDSDANTAGAAARGLKPLVTDCRNLLFLRPLGTDTDDATLKTLAYALRRAAQLMFQVEEQELAAELIGEHAQRRVLLWEAAEGGVGVAERLLTEAERIRGLARGALSVVHCDAGTNADHGQEIGCTAACYRCLLSYSNQIDHGYLDRRRVVPLLCDLAGAMLLPEAAGRGYDEQYRWLLDRIDPSSSFERKFLDELFRRRLRLPDQAQYVPTDELAVQGDFYFGRDTAPGVRVFVDGPQHDTSGSRLRDETLRSALRARGFRVVAIAHQDNLVAQLATHPNLFRLANVKP